MMMCLYPSTTVKDQREWVKGLACETKKKIYIYRATSICGVLIFEWVLIFQNFIVMVSLGTYI